MVVERVGLGVEANLEGVAVVGVESEIGQKEVGQQVFVVVDVAGTSRERFLGLEEKGLQVANDGLAKAEDDVVGVQPGVDVGGRLAEFDAGDGCGLRHLLAAAVGGQSFLHAVH